MKKTITRPSKLPPKNSVKPQTDIVGQVANAVKTLTIPPPTPIVPQHAMAQATAQPAVGAASAQQRFTPIEQQQPPPWGGNSGPAPVNFPANPNPAPKIPKQTGEAAQGTVNKMPVINIHNYYPQQSQQAPAKGKE
jgi:hypothetical protein